MEQTNTMPETQQTLSKSQRFKCKVRDDQEVGRWKKEEHENFIKGLKLYGKDWKKIEALVGTRNGAQIRSHAQKFFSKLSKASEDKTSNNPDIKLLSLDCKSKNNSDDDMVSSTGCAKKRDMKEVIKEVGDLVQSQPVLATPPPNPILTNQAQSQAPAAEPMQAPTIQNKMYSEEDILLLIKFIVKEFAQIVQKWMSGPALGTPLFSMNNMPQGNMNTMLLSALLARETANIQNQEMLQSQLMQQVNSILLADMLDQNKNGSGDSSPLERTKNASVTSFPQTTTMAQEYRQKDEDAEEKAPMRQYQENKDEIETIQSSEDKTQRQRAISDEPNENLPNRIDMNQAYTILEKNQVLGSLIKTFSSFSN